MHLLYKMDEKICLPYFHFSIIMLSLIGLFIWTLCNYFKNQNQNQQGGFNNPFSDISTKLNGLLFGGGRSGSIPVQILPPAGPSEADLDAMDDAVLGNMPPARRDYRKMYDPLQTATRRYTYDPVVYASGGPYNERTRGYYPGNQMMGFLSTPDDPDRMLKLYGRRLDRYRYEYYTTHHDDPHLKLPIKNRGDKEFMEGDVVKIPGYDREYVVNLYEFESPRYLPFL
jgi:hypothetical protein